MRMATPRHVLSIYMIVLEIMRRLRTQRLVGEGIYQSIKLYAILANALRARSSHEVKTFLPLEEEQPLSSFKGSQAACPQTSQLRMPHST